MEHREPDKHPFVAMKALVLLGLMAGMLRQVDKSGRETRFFRAPERYG
jgi:hypothetical protein